MFKQLFIFWLLPIFGMFFAAGADGLGSAGGDTGAGDLGGDLGGDTGAEGGEGGAGEEGAEGEESLDLPDERPPQRQEPQEEPEAGEFRVQVGRRMVGLVNKFPKLKEAFAAHPDLQKELEPVFRRESAYREVFPTIAEARQVREEFPNGLADVQQFKQELQEVEQLDADFEQSDRDGNYPGHQRIVENMFRQDRKAAVSLFKSLPKLWATLDRESYSEVMGKIVGITIQSGRAWQNFDRTYELAKAANNPELLRGLDELAGWANGFISEKPRPSAEEERLTQERKRFDQEKSERDKQDGTRFNQEFVGTSRKLQEGVIRTHPAVKRLMESKAVTPAKKQEILEQARKAIEQHLGKSRSFMSKLRPAYQARNLKEIQDIQRAAWSQPWLLNMYIRQVFSKEIPQLVSANKSAVNRRAGTSTTKTNTSGEKKETPKGPVQIGGRWYRDGGKGAPFTTAEVLAGKHQQ